MSDLDLLLKEEVTNPDFCKAWDETELEDQIKRMMIEVKLEKNMTQKQLADVSMV